jgi:D-alanyl-D-alanine endopeptidase (penicillin-binding protein 7)
MVADSFIVRMNEKARALGMDSTHIVEPTGLSEQNISTAYECAVLLEAALCNHLIREITSTPEVTIKPLNRKRQHHLVNTNRLMRYGYEFRGSKTGYINESGWCVAASGVAADGHDVTVVVLGAPSNSLRFQALRNALSWAYKFPLRPIAGS